MKTLLLSAALYFALLGCQSKSKTSNPEIQTVRAEGLIQKTEFNPYGYYFPDAKVKLKSTILEWIFVATNEEDAHQTIEYVELNLRDTVSETKQIIKVDQFKITHDSFTLKINDSIVGSVIIENKYTGKNGPSNDDVKEGETIVLTGTVITDNSKYNVNYTWTAGD